MALVLVLVNALWLTAFTLFDAVVWATIAHSIQYLLVVVLAHGKVEKGPSNVRAKQDLGLRMGTFYGASIALGMVLFLVGPLLVQQSAAIFGLTWALSQCYLMLVAALNLHHFIVDGYIWRSPKKLSAPAPRRQLPELGSLGLGSYGTSSKTVHRAS